MSETDYADIQGLVRFGYGHMTSASYVLVKIKDPAAAKTSLRASPVTSAVALKPLPKAVLNIAFTAPSLRELGVPNSIIDEFSREFRGNRNSNNRFELKADAIR
jgi:hypothetical protein